MKPESSRSERSRDPAPGDTAAHPAEGGGLWEQLLSRSNLAEALRRVEQNAGAAGIDGMSTEDLRPWLVEHWPEVRSALEAGTYRPRPVRRVMIPKSSGGQRALGVPVVVDRLICQAIAQVLSPVFDPHFHPHSFGFRPGRSAHQAVERARQFIVDGAVWCVDFDLDSFFDRVQHDVLMARVARRVGDRRLLRLIRLYLQAGIMEDGLVRASVLGTPQGSPLSPLLSNIILDGLDWELERRGLCFVRYADDGRVYVHSRRAAERVMDHTCRYIEQRLRLKVNREKSVVDRAERRTLLGFGFLRRGGRVTIRIDPKAPQRAKGRLRELTSRTWGVSMQRRIKEINRFIVGWTAYFRLVDHPRPLADLDEWLRRRLRQARWKEWPRYQTRRRNLVALGIPDWQAKQWAATSKGYWRLAGSRPLQRAMPNQYWTALGLRSFTDNYNRFRDAERTAGCGPARPVVWGAPG